MKLLLDTHVILWWLADDPRIPRQVKDMIETGGRDVAVSAVTGFEIAVKKALGKLEAPDDFEEQIDEADFTILPLFLRHGVMGGGLPMHHRDPFDRLLIAQALCERMVIVTGDSTIGAYGVPVLPV